MRQTKPSMGSTLKLYAAVTAIAVMVWVVAEGQTLQRQTLEMRVRFIGNQQHAAEVQTEGWTGAVKVTFEGSASMAGDLVGLNGELVTLEPGQGGVPIEDGVHTIDLRSSIREVLTTRRSALSVVQVEPPTASLRVVSLERVEQPIEVVLPEGIQASGVTVAPPSVILLAPVGSLPPGGVQARVVLDAASLAGLPRGRVVTLNDRAVTVVGREGSMPSSGVTIEPASVTVDLELQTVAGRVTLATVPIVVQLPPTELNRWDVVIPDADRVLRDVTLTGPATLLEAYRTGERELLAVVRLGFEELERRIEGKRAEFPGLGQGVTVSVEDPEVQLRISPRAAGGG